MVFHKKSVAAETLLYLLGALVSFIVLTFVIMLFVDRSDVDTALPICRSSIALREQSTVGVDFMNLNTKLAPLFCKTFDLTFPERRFEDIHPGENEAVYRNIADRIADCWWQFGQGVIEKDIFGKNMGWGRDRCFTCYTFSIKDKELYREIDPDILYFYMDITPYTAAEVYLPMCTGQEGEDKNSCVDVDAPECERKGGVCSSIELQYPPFDEYPLWSCNRNQKCYVDESMLITYFDFMDYHAPGILMIDDDIFENGYFSTTDVYAISFISSTTDMGWTWLQIGSYLIPGWGRLAYRGGAALVKVGGRLVARGLPKAAPRVAPAVTTTSTAGYQVNFVYHTGSSTQTVATSVAQTTGGAPAAVKATAPSLNKLQRYLGATGSALTIEGAKQVEADELFYENEFKEDLEASQIILVSKLDNLQGRCKVVTDFGDT